MRRRQRTWRPYQGRTSGGEFFGESRLNLQKRVLVTRDRRGAFGSNGPTIGKHAPARLVTAERRFAVDYREGGARPRSGWRMAFGGELSPLINIGALQIWNSATTIVRTSGSAKTRREHGNTALAVESVPTGEDFISQVQRCPFFFADAGFDAFLVSQQDFGATVDLTSRELPHLSAHMPVAHRTAHSDSRVVPSNTTKANSARNNIEAGLGRCNIGSVTRYSSQRCPSIS